jgi:hypothetical protein
LVTLNLSLKVSLARTAMQPTLIFDVWKALLRQDCVRQNKLLAYDSLGDYVLAMLWKQGVDPSVEGITKADGKRIGSAA